MRRFTVAVLVVFLVAAACSADVVVAERAIGDPTVVPEATADTLPTPAPTEIPAAAPTVDPTSAPETPTSPPAPTVTPAPTATPQPTAAPIPPPPDNLAFTGSMDSALVALGIIMILAGFAFIVLRRRNDDLVQQDKAKS